MPKLPQKQNSQRWEPPTSIRLRTGQKKLYEVISSTKKNQYTIELPTGYGKSWCACIAYATLRGQGRVNRMLIVVPTDQQRTQYIQGLQDDLGLLGIEYSGIERCDNSATWVIKKSLRNQSDIFVAGIGSIAADPGYYADLMVKHSWLVVADEFHHYGAENTWGKALKDLPYEVIFGMSATPFRNDKTETIFGNSTFDVQVSLDEALREKAIRPIKSSISDYKLSWYKPGGDVMTGLMSDFVEEAGGLANVQSYEVKERVRFSSKYVHSIFTRTLDAWAEYEEFCPRQNQILVFAMTCEHAKSLVDVINALTKDTYPQPFADWIGAGKIHARTDQENDDVLESFQKNKLKCLVQVNKAGEGFNNNRCSIGLMLDMVGDSPTKRQHLGRFMRVNPRCVNEKGEELPALIFLSEDAPCRPLFDGSCEVLSEVEQDASGEIHDRVLGERFCQLSLGDIIVVDAEWESERFAWPFGSKEKFIDSMIAQEPRLQSASRSDIEEIVANLFRQHMKSEYPEKTSEERRKDIQEQVNRKVGKLANYLARKRFGETFPKTVIGDYFKTINGRWIREKQIRHKEMTEEELMQKFEWLKTLAADIQEKGIPTWLSL